MRGREGPVISRSSRPTRVVGEVLRRERASWTEEEDFPTPPLPDKTMMIFLTEANRRETGVSTASVIAICQAGASCLLIRCLSCLQLIADLINVRVVVDDREDERDESAKEVDTKSGGRGFKGVPR